MARVDPRLRVDAVDYFFNNKSTIREVAAKYALNYKSLARWVKTEKNKGRSQLEAPNIIKYRGDIKERGQEDFLYFATKILGLGWKDKVGEGINDPPAPVHERMARLVNQPERFKLGMYPRFTYKTTLLTSAQATWDVCRDPEETITIASESWEKSRRILFEIKQHLLHNEKLIDLYGTFVPKKDPERGSLWNRNFIYINQRQNFNKQPSIMTTGVGCDITGTHPTKFYADDLVGRKNITTFDQKQKVVDFFNDIIYVCGNHGKLMVNGTHWASDDAYVYMKKNWLQRMDGNTGNMLFAFDLMALEEDGKSIFPAKFSPEYIQTLKDTTPLNEYACQFENNPRAGGNTLVRPEDYDWLERTAFSSFPKFANPDYWVYIGVDPGATTNPKSCYTGIVVLIADPPYDLYCIEARRLKAEPSVVMDELVELCKKPQYRGHIRTIGIEKIGFQKTYKDSLYQRLFNEGIYGIEVRGLDSDDSKDRRIYSLEPIFRHHQMHLAVGQKDALDQIGHYPHLSENNRDILDAMHMAVRIIPVTEFKIKAGNILEGRLETGEVETTPPEGWIPPSERAGFDWEEYYARQDAQAW